MAPLTLRNLIKALADASMDTYLDQVVMVGNLPVVAVKKRARKEGEGLNYRYINEVYLELGPREDLEFIRPNWPVGGDL